MGAKTAFLILLCVLFVWMSIFTGGCDSKAGGKNEEELIIFHAGSLSVPLKEICDKYEQAHPEVTIMRESAGSRMCARKISDLKKPCDIMASADYTVIDTLLIPDYADWDIRFANNEMVIAFSEQAEAGKEIHGDNWHQVLMRKEVSFGRSAPEADPCGYRSVLLMKLAEMYYGSPGLAELMLAKDTKYIRPKEVDLLALLEAGEIDYMFIYRSVAEQHGLKYVLLPDQINLKAVEYDEFYKKASVQLTGKEPGRFVTKTGSAIVYGVTIPHHAPNRDRAVDFLKFMLNSDQGGVILEKNGQGFIVPSSTDTYDKILAALQMYAQPAGAIGS